MVAGLAETQDVIMCQLKPASAADYKAKFTDAQLARLTKVFSEGVCDWSKPGVGQQPPAGTWQYF